MYLTEILSEVVESGFFVLKTGPACNIREHRRHRQFRYMKKWFFRVMGRSICDPNDREKSFGAPDVQITPLTALIRPSAQTIFLSTQPQGPGLFGVPTH